VVTDVDVEVVDVDGVVAADDAAKTTTIIILEYLSRKRKTAYRK